MRCKDASKNVNLLIISDIVISITLRDFLSFFKLRFYFIIFLESRFV